MTDKTELEKAREGLQSALLRVGAQLAPDIDLDSLCRAIDHHVEAAEAEIAGLKKVELNTDDPMRAEIHCLRDLASWAEKKEQFQDASIIRGAIYEILNTRRTIAKQAEEIERLKLEIDMRVTRYRRI